MGSNRRNLPGILFAVVSGMLFTVGAVTNRFVFSENDFEPYRYVASVLFVGGGFGFVDLCLRPASTKQNLRQANKLYLILAIGVLSALAIGLMMYGQSLTTSTNTSIVSTAIILTTALFAFLVAKEKPTPNSKIWLPVLFMGLYVATVGVRGFDINTGDLFILAAIVVYGLNNAITKIAVSSFDPRFVADVFWFIGAVLHTSIALFVYGKTFFVTQVFAFVALSAFAGWLNGVASNEAIQRIGANRWISLNITHIVFTMVAALLLLDEQMTAEKIIGAVLIVTAVCKVNQKRKSVAASDTSRGVSVSIDS